MSPLMSLMKTGTPASESCSARTWSVFVLPVPVAPATRPWRFIIASGTRTWTDGQRLLAAHGGAEGDAGRVEAVARGERRLEVGRHQRV